MTYQSHRIVKSFGLNRSNIGIVGTNPTRGMKIEVNYVLSVSLSCVGKEFYRMYEDSLFKIYNFKLEQAMRSTP